MNAPAREPSLRPGHCLRLPGGVHAPVPGVWRVLHLPGCDWLGYWQPLAWSYLPGQYLARKAGG